MPYLDQFIALAIIGILGAASPGPDFVIVTQHSLKHGRLAGLGTALGITLGCTIHLSYCIIGIGVLVTQSPLLFQIIKWFGASYLIYLGIRGLAAKNTFSLTHLPVNSPSKLEINFQQAALKGFMINLFNPKATLFFISIFSQFVDPKTPKAIQALFGLEFCLISLLWFSMLALLLSHQKFKMKLMTVQPYIEKILSAALIIFGIRIATLAI